MSTSDNHTPIPDHISDQKFAPTPPSSIPTPPAPHFATLGSKEHEPIATNAEQKMAQEDAKESEKGNEESRSEKGKSTAKMIQKTPIISKEAKDAGLAVAPSAKPFPTIYDVKVPIYNDVQIEENLHKSFWTGARWLAEICKYLLWQSHIKLKKIGGKIIRQQT